MRTWAGRSREASGSHDEPALADLDEIFANRAERAPMTAEKWRLRLLKCVDKLEKFAEGLPLAPEAAAKNRPIRQILFGRRPHVYRILFEVHEDYVGVIHIRHGARNI